MASLQLLCFALFLGVAVEEVLGSAKLLHTLRCKLPYCAPPPRGCRSFVSVDEIGCPSKCNYACGAPWCGPRSCREPCYGGYKRNPMGCVTCECKPTCKKQLCRNNCPYGRQKDEKGCITCTCKSKPLPCHEWITCPREPCADSCKCKPDCYSGPAPDTPAGTSAKSGNQA